MKWQQLLGSALIRAGNFLEGKKPGDTFSRDAHVNPVDDTLSPAVAGEQIRGLFHSALTAKRPEGLVQFTEFCSQFRRYSVFNARLIQTQRRGARACATQKEWNAVGRTVLPDARPIIILWPFGPVAHVYDLEDTGPVHDRAAIGDPFAATSALPVEGIIKTITKLIEGCKSESMFRVHVEGDRLGFGLAGSAATQGSLPLLLPDDAAASAHANVHGSRSDATPIPAKSGTKERLVPCWRVKVNDRLTPAEYLVTLAHELGHIFCGHLGGCEGIAGRGGWVDRSGLNHHEMEMEAEAVAWLVAQRAGIMSPSPIYLKRHVESGDVRKVNTDVVVRATSRIESLAGVRYAK